LKHLICHHSELSDPVLEQVAALDQTIFLEPIPKEYFERRLRGRRNVSVLVATTDGQLSGYKLGYEETQDVFFSFSGGVAPPFRRKGLARALMQEQHRIARELGYSVVFTRTKNKYREMLLLNIQAGFNITGVQNRTGERFPSILLEKSLNEP
jgi:GNAT superfamily N-acetyltransferase